MTISARKSSYRKFLSGSVSVGALLFVSIGSPVFAEESGEAEAVSIPAVNIVAQSSSNGAANPILETNRYFMRLMTQIFDGSREFSHTQTAAFARKRQDNISWTMLDFGDGAVVITQPDALSVSGFKNTSKAELGVLYNYDTKTIDGDSAVANFHNNYVRPQLDRAPDLGSNVRWSTAMPLSALGVTGISGQQLKLELSREYFTHDGKEMVLLQYKVPALRFDDDSGTTVVHWGKGFALTDPGFGNIYASAALHRSVADEGDVQKRPYRYYRSGFASNNDGKMMLDIKKIPAVAKIYDDYFSANALQVIPYDDNTGAADQRPVTLAANIDVMALSIAENGANDGGTLAGAQVNGDRGNERAINIANTLSVDSVEDRGIVFGQETGLNIVPHESLHSIQGNSSTSGPENLGGPPNAGNSNGSGFDIPEDTLENLQSSTGQTGDPFSNVTGGPNTQTAFGNQGEEQANQQSGSLDAAVTTSKVTGGLIYAGDKGTAIVGGVDATLNGANTATNFANVQRDVQKFATETNRLYGKFSIAKDRFGLSKDVLEQALKSDTAFSIQLKPSAQRLLGTVENLTGQMASFDRDFNKLDRYLTQGAGADLDAVTKTALRQDAAKKFVRLSGELDTANAAFDTAVKNGAYVTEYSPRVQNLIETAQKNAAVLLDLQDDVSGLAKKTLSLTEKLKEFSPSKVGEILNKFSNSPAGKILDGVSTGLNVIKTGQAGYNAVNAANNDLSGGQLSLTGSYVTLDGDLTLGDALAVGGLGLDILALGGNLASGNMKGFWTDAAAITTGSISDIYVANKAYNDTLNLVTATYEQGRDLQRRLTAKIKAKEDQKLADLKATPFGLEALTSGEDPYKDGYDTSDPRFDSETGLPDPAYWAYLKENDPQKLTNMGVDPNAPVGGWPPETAASTDLSREELIAGLETELDKSDYPTAPPRETYVKDKPDPAEANLGKTSELSQAQLDQIATAQRKQAAQDKLDAQQAERAKDLPQIDNFDTPEERQAYYEQQLEAADAERRSGLPPLDNFETPAERQAYYEQKLEDVQAERSKGLPAIDNFNTPEERKAYYQQQRDAARAENESGLPPVDNFKTPTERQAYYQQQRDDALAESSSGLPPIDRYMTPEERKTANQKILDDRQAERTKGLPEIDNFSSPEERKAANQKYLEDTLKDRLAARDEEFVGPIDRSFRVTDLKTSDLTVSSFDIKPVVFQDVNFDKDNDLFDEDGNLRKVGPDDFVMTAFDAPSISDINFSNFADDDYPGGNHVSAFTYEGMSGTVATDLGPWAEWLLTQDIKNLERLARQAGYPNLASALNDAENLIRQADDSGYRKWAMAPPGCTGSNGCGPQYLERWTMKRSTLGLGDILRADRAFFSTSGLTDISIANLMLMFSIIDFGIDDGDRVNISVTQFGQSLLNQSLTINTGGTKFSVPVRPGVVAVNLKALNTGEFPPNTAALSIQGVTGGDSDQNYSLDNGETAGLRVNVGGNQ